MPPGVSVLSRYKPFWKSGSYDITSGCVHLDVRWDRSVYQPTQWTVAKNSKLFILSYVANTVFSTIPTREESLVIKKSICSKIGMTFHM